MMQGEVQPCAWRAGKMQGEVCAGSGRGATERARGLLLGGVKMA